MKVDTIIDMPKHITKTACERLHAKRRARQRLGINLNKHYRRGLIQQIQNNKFEFVKKQSNRISWFKAVINNIPTIIVYDKMRHNIVTFLYEEELNEEQSKEII